MTRRTGLVLLFALLALILHNTSLISLPLRLIVTWVLSPYWILPVLGTVILTLVPSLVLFGYLTLGIAWSLGVPSVRHNCAKILDGILGRNKVTK